MKERHLAFIDTETTGLLTETHEIIQIGLVLTRQIREGKESFLEVIEEWEVKVAPVHIERAEKTALEVNGYSEEKWKDAIPLKDALEILSRKTDGAIMVGHNVSFDWAFLEQGFENTGVRNRMHYHKLDTIAVAFSQLYHEEKIQNFTLKTLCAHFGIENKDAHTALSDARATMELFIKLLGLGKKQTTLF